MAADLPAAHEQASAAQPFFAQFLLKTRLKLAAYLAHVRRADGSWPSDWAFARLAILRAQQVLHQHLTDVRLPHKLTSRAYEASEDLRASASFATDWAVLQAQVIRVVPVVQQVLRTLADKKDSA